MRLPLFLCALVASALLAAPRLSAASVASAALRPARGESLTRKGAEIPSATLDAAALADFVTRYERAPETALFLRGIELLRANAFIPLDAVDALKRILPPDTRTERDDGNAVHPLRFSGDAQLTLTIDWTRRIVRDVTPSAPLPLADKMSAPTARRTSLEDALAHFKVHLIAEGLEPARQRLSATYYGERTIILSRELLEPVMQPALESIRYVLDARLSRMPIQEFSPQALASAIDAELAPWPKTKRLDVIVAYLGLENTGTLIESVNDIPDYRRSPLDADLAATVRKPFEVPARPGTSRAFWVCYTYARMGGVVTRYRFEFGADGLANVTPTVLATQIGAAIYRM